MEVKNKTILVPSEEEDNAFDLTLKTLENIAQDESIPNSLRKIALDTWGKLYDFYYEYMD